MIPSSKERSFERKAKDALVPLGHFFGEEEYSFLHSFDLQKFSFFPLVLKRLELVNVTLSCPLKLILVKIVKMKQFA
jgi:hypothetical protein